jgi:hypothetical protein
MGKQGAIRAGRAYVELFADNSPLIRGLGLAKAKLMDWGRSVQRIGLKVMAAGSALAAPLIFSVKHFMNFGHELEEMSAKTGIGVEALSELTYAAERSGVDTETLTAALRGMNNTIGEAAGSSKEAKKALAGIGLSVEDLLALSPEDRFMVVADRINRIGDVSKRTAAAMDVLKRGGVGLLPMLQNLPGARQHARALGLTVSSNDARAAAQLHDAMFDLWKVIKMVAFVTGAALAPTLVDLAKKASIWLVRAIAWLRQNKGLIITVAKLAVGLVGLGAALVGLGVAMKMAGTLAGILQTVLSVVGSVLGVLLSPIGLVTAGILALGAAVAWMTGYAGKALSWLGGTFQGLRDDMGKAIQGIGDALAAGDIGLAVKILWLTLKLEFLKGTEAIRVFWAKWLHQMQYGFERMTDALVRVFLSASYSIQRAWVRVSSFFQDIWERATTAVAKGITHVMGMFDSTLDVDYANKVTDQASQAKLAAINAEKDAALMALDAEQKDTEKGAEETHKRELARIEKEGHERIQAAQDAVKNARAEWEEAIKKAAAERAALGTAPPPGMPAPPPGMPALPTAPELAAQAERKVSVAGTFQGTALWGLGAGGSAAERTAKATEKIASAAEVLKKTGADIKAGVSVLAGIFGIKY